MKHKVIVVNNGYSLLLSLKLKYIFQNIEFIFIAADDFSTAIVNYRTRVWDTTPVISKYVSDTFVPQNVSNFDIEAIIKIISYGGVCSVSWTVYLSSTYSLLFGIFLYILPFFETEMNQTKPY